MAAILLVLREGYDGWALGVKEDGPMGGGGMLSPPFKDDSPETSQRVLTPRASYRTSQTFIL